MQIPCSAAAVVRLPLVLGVVLQLCQCQNVFVSPMLPGLAYIPHVPHMPLVHHFYTPSSYTHHSRSSPQTASWISPSRMDRQERRIQPQGTDTNTNGVVLDDEEASARTSVDIQAKQNQLSSTRGM